MAAPKANSSGVSQPAVLQLAELNRRSASLGSWDICIFTPEIHECTYTDKTTQQEKKGADCASVPEPVQSNSVGKHHADCAAGPGTSQSSNIGEHHADCADCANVPAEMARSNAKVVHNIFTPPQSFRGTHDEPTLNDDSIHEIEESFDKVASQLKASSTGRKWKRYLDTRDESGWWYCLDDDDDNVEFFLENTPKEWELYICPTTRKQYWWNSLTEECFFT